MCRIHIALEDVSASSAGAFRFLRFVGQYNGNNAGDGLNFPGSCGACVPRHGDRLFSIDSSGGTQDQNRGWVETHPRKRNGGYLIGLFDMMITVPISTGKAPRHIGRGRGGEENATRSRNSRVRTTAPCYIQA